MISPRQFGSTLRRQRERQNITLKMLEARTKISVSLLSALEKGDCSRWPAGIYSRSWVRAYAQAVGLDPEATVTQFAACFADTAFPDAPPRQETDPQDQGGLRLALEPDPGARLRAMAIRAAFAALDLTLVGLVGVLAWFFGYLGFLPAVAAATLLVHIVGVVSGQGSTIGAALHLARAAREPHARERERARESALAEVA